jgi:hypothetical protein
VGAQEIENHYTVSEFAPAQQHSRLTAHARWYARASEIGLVGCWVWTVGLPQRRPVVISVVVVVVVVVFVVVVVLAGHHLGAPACDDDASFSFRSLRSLNSHDRTCSILSQWRPCLKVDSISTLLVATTTPRALTTSPPY